MSLGKKILYYKYFYILLIIPIISYVLFSYLPMYGITLAFREYSFTKGIFGSSWVGLKYCREVFSNQEFWNACFNTIFISLGRLVFEFPVPIVFSFLINEIARMKFKRVIQTVFTFPHFVSWVVVSGLFITMLSSDGIVNQLVTALGGPRLSLLTNPMTFRGLLYLSADWKEFGWGTIIYLAAMANINSELYAAATVDGAKRFQLMRYITWPVVRSVMGILLILNVGSMLNTGFDQIINMYNPIVFKVSDIIDTYVYRQTFINGLNFSTATAIGLFKTVFSFIMLLTANLIVQKVTDEGLF